MAFLGLPNLILTTAVNQRYVGKGLDEWGCSKNLGWYEDISEQIIAEAIQSLINDQIQRQRMSGRGRELIDGKGTKKVMRELCRN